MVRGKVQMKRIENATSRQVTFSKRRNGLLKKAYELSVLCDAEVAAIIFSPKGRLYEFSSSDMQKTIERYHKYAKGVKTDKPEMERYTQQPELEAANMVRKIELIEASQRKLLGQGLGSCSVEELQEVESQLERSLRNIRARKDHLFMEQIEQLKAKERFLREENAKLSAKSGGERWQPSTQQKETATYSSQSSLVETELFIGLPENRCS
ncbi:MADS-box protein AGL42-like [Durio zibethinus]|uniref:MADS-box protein AGL42-like n=1 Tax=Durio zibethinus TaxID=66656 RepID=A0A6P6BB63_DURZI|nr:MADS-box protein AGL42-like [Durio zibethinus]